MRTRVLFCLILISLLLSGCIQIRVIEQEPDTRLIEIVLLAHTPPAGTASPTKTLTPTFTAVVVNRDTALPTHTPLPPMDTPVPSDTPAPPTSTLAPSDSPVPSTPKATQLPARPTVTASSPAESTEPTPYPSPLLLEPGADTQLRGRARFRWQWDGLPLDEDHFFDLRIWSQQEEDAGIEPRGVVAPTKMTEAEVDLKWAPAVQDYGPGVYYWTVVVVEGAQNPRVVSEWGERRLLRYATAEEQSPGWDWPFPGWP